MKQNLKRVQTASYYTVFVGVGLATSILGPTLPYLAQQTQTQLDQISIIFPVFALGYLLGSLLGGRLYDRLAGHRLMIVMLALLAAVLAATPLMPTLALMGALWILLGIAGGTLDVGGNTLLIWVHGRNVPPYMNGLHFFFGLGSFLSPVIVGQVISRQAGPQWAYWSLALLIVPIAFFVARLPSPSSPPVRRESAASTPGTDRTRWLIGLIVVLLGLYVGAEAGFGGWIFSYTRALDLGSEATAAYLTSAFWGALTVGRLLSIPIAARLTPRTLLLSALLTCLLGLGAILLWPNSASTLWGGTLAVGLGMATIFPTVLSLAERHMTISGRITGWFLAGSSAGGMFLPWFIGQFFESTGARATMAILAVDLLLALIVLVALLILSARQLSVSPTIVYNEQDH